MKNIKLLMISFVLIFICGCLLSPQVYYPKKAIDDFILPEKTIYISVSGIYVNFESKFLMRDDWVSGYRIFKITNNNITVDDYYYLDKGEINWDHDSVFMKIILKPKYQLKKNIKIYKKETLVIILEASRTKKYIIYNYFQKEFINANAYDIVNAESHWKNETKEQKISL